MAAKKNLGPGIATIIVGILLALFVSSKQQPAQFADVPVAAPPSQATGTAPEAAPLELLQKPVPGKSFYAPILMYHHVSNTARSGPYNVTPDMFAEQMQWLHDNHYHVIAYDQFFDALKSKQTLPDNPVVITFDDGYRDQYENAFPVLKKYGYPALFFVYTRAVEKDDPVFMNWDMIGELLKQNMTIGSHTVSHPNLAKLSPERVAYELVESKKVLEAHVHGPVRFFAYPGGADSKSVVAAVKQAGYDSAVTTVHKVIHPYTENPLLVGRIHVDNDMHSFEQFIRGWHLNGFGL